MSDKRRAHDDEADPEEEDYERDLHCVMDTDLEMLAGWLEDWDKLGHE